MLKLRLGKPDGEGRGGSRHERSGGAMMRGAIVGGKSGLFASQGATGESGKVR